MLILWAWCCLCLAVMCSSFWTPEQGEERGIYILSMRCLQISHPCIIIYAKREGEWRGARGAEARELILLTPLWKLKSIISQSDQRLCFHTSLYLFGYNKCRCKTKVLPISQGKTKARVWCFLIETKSLFRVDQRRPVMGLIVHGEVNKHHGNISFAHLPSQERTFKIWIKRFQFDGC